MNNILICADGGCSGHFLACLIRSMWDDKFFENYPIPTNGSCDTISHAGCLHIDYALVEQKLNLYPEREEAMSLILDAVVSPENTYGKFLKENFKQYDYINVLHYWKKPNLEKLLEIHNVKIIHVRVDQKDLKRIAFNKIYKNITNNIDYSQIGMSAVKTNLKGLLTWAGITDHIEEINNINSMKDLSSKIKLDLIEAWAKKVELSSSINEPPNPNHKLLVLQFDDIMNNKEKIMNDLATFTNSKVDETTKRMYTDYLSKQPTMEYFLNNATN
jgi:hypothetical protein